MNSNESLIIVSDDSEEWYGRYETCSVCDAQFMCDDPIFCPICGRKFIGSKVGDKIMYISNEPLRRKALTTK